MGAPSATRWEAVAIRGCHLLQSLRSFGKWYPRLPSGQPPADGGEKCRGCHPPAEVWWWREVPWMSPSSRGCSSYPLYLMRLSSPFPIPRFTDKARLVPTSPIPHSPFLIPRSSFLIPRSTLNHGVFVDEVVEQGIDGEAGHALDASFAHDVLAVGGDGKHAHV